MTKFLIYLGKTILPCFIAVLLVWVILTSIRQINWYTGEKQRDFYKIFNQLIEGETKERVIARLGQFDYRDDGQRRIQNFQNCAENQAEEKIGSFFYWHNIHFLSYSYHYVVGFSEDTLKFKCVVEDDLD